MHRVLLTLESSNWELMQQLNRYPSRHMIYEDIHTDLFKTITLEHIFRMNRNVYGVPITLEHITHRSVFLGRLLLKAQYTQSIWAYMLEFVAQFTCLDHWMHNSGPTFQKNQPNYPRGALAWVTPKEKKGSLRPVALPVPQR
jgi:hypothetical protein